MVSNLRGGRNDHLELIMNVEDYLAQTGHAFLPPHNPSDYPPTMGSAQEQALGTKRLRKNQALFWHCTAIVGIIKKQTVMAVQQVFLSPIMDQLRGFEQVRKVSMLQHIFRSYGAIYEIDLEENFVKMIGVYDPSEPPNRLIYQLEKGREFSRAGGKTIADAMMVSKGITVLEKMATVNDDIR